MIPTFASGATGRRRDAALTHPCHAVRRAPACQGLTTARSQPWRGGCCVRSYRLHTRGSTEPRFACEWHMRGAVISLVYRCHRCRGSWRPERGVTNGQTASLCPRHSSATLERALEHSLQRPQSSSLQIRYLHQHLYDIIAIVETDTRAIRRMKFPLYVVPLSRRHLTSSSCLSNSSLIIIHM